MGGDCAGCVWGGVMCVVLSSASNFAKMAGTVENIPNGGLSGLSGLGTRLSCVG